MGRKTGIFLVFKYIFTNVLSKGFSQRRDFQRMSQSGTDKITFIQGKYLGFILKPAKLGASDNPMIILLKFASQIRSFFTSRVLPFPPFGQ